MKRLNRSFSWAVLLVALALLLPIATHAQEPSADDAQQAVVLFQEGRAALDAGDANAACKKFEASIALDEQVGTLLNLALCEEKRQNLVRALEHWKRAIDVASARNDDRRSVAEQRSKELMARIPRLTVIMPSNAPSSTTVQIQSEGASRTLSPEEIGQPLQIDPGPLTIVVTNDSGSTSQDITIVEREDKSVTLQLPTAGTEGDMPVGPGAGSGGASPLLIAGLVAGGLGVVGVAVGLAFGGQAKSKWEERTEGEPPACDPENRCTQEGLDRIAESQKAADISTGLFVAGAVLLGAGITLVVIDLTVMGEPEAAGSSKMRIGVSPTGASATMTW